MLGEDKSIALPMMDYDSFLPNIGMGPPIDGNKQLPAVAIVGIYGQTLEGVPGSSGALASDHLVARRDELRSKSEPTEDEQKELVLIERALANLDAASVRLENVGPFWNYEGWNYSPKTTEFRPPQVQAYGGYTWSFDLTRYAYGLYSTPLDILSEVVASTPRPQTPEDERQPGEIDARARELIAAARRAVQPVRIRFGEDGPEVFAASGDRFAVESRSDMYLGQRMVCDGEHIYHIYDELGLAASRDATEMRRAALRWLAPHLVEPADTIAARFDVELAEETDRGFDLRLTPRGSGDETPQPKVEVAMFVLPDGRIERKSLSVDGETRLTMSLAYEGSDVTVRWLDDNAEELAKLEFSATPLSDEAAGKAFDADVASKVVINMPLRKPSYYEARLEKVDAADKAEMIRLKRHLALAKLQELNWRRWGQVNGSARETMVEVATLLQGEGRKVLLGDLALMGSAGAHQPNQALPGEKDYAGDHPLVQFFHHRNSWHSREGIAYRDSHSGTLTGHLAAYQVSTSANQEKKHFDVYAESYPESPLMLAAAYFCSNWGNQPEPWFSLCENTQWRGLALMMSSHMLRDDQQKARFVEQFGKWRQELQELGLDVPIDGTIAGVLKPPRPLERDLGRPVEASQGFRACRARAAFCRTGAAVGRAGAGPEGAGGGPPPSRQGAVAAGQAGAGPGNVGRP